MRVGSRSVHIVPPRKPTMSRFNVPKKSTKVTKIRAKRNLNTSKVVVNKAGGKAYSQSDDLEIASMILTSLFKDTYYASSEESRERLKTLVAKNPLFAAKAAVYARNEFGLRSVSHAVAGEIAASVKGEQWTKKFFNAVVRRVDDITEILAYYLQHYGKPIPNSLVGGLKKSFDKFDAYRLAKYKGEDSALSLVDAVNLVHPKPNEKNAKALNDLIDGTLKNTKTWESMLSAVGNDTEAKAQVWETLIDADELGYMALLKNLRNIATQASESTLTKALNMLVDPEKIKKSLVLPFRFASAYDAVSALPGVNKILAAISQACDIATVQNVPAFKGKTLVVVDSSGSMGNARDEKSPSGIATQFAAIILKANPEADLMCFSTDAKYISVDPTSGVMAMREEIISKQVSGGTNFHAIFQKASKAYEHVVVLSDMQGWMQGGAPDASVAAYKTKYKANPYIYSFDLTGLGTLQFPQEKVYCIAGFSDKVFTLLDLLRQDKNVLTKVINNVQF